ncbi:hypothetical protein AURDEDRAFT_177294 [Auricularia subglabra TFB-10046 SS5]|uniref:F-box domain-containing protein n=1 Tax=Auricularia subglabra (strain TFB-10046 / SS5) TaxID=717982 RepID=J0D4G1_AURST|nr:hypothetical protein AURDEDRAFT_177294 [Auricularia subglabra TFB-10046 SS5]
MAPRNIPADLLSVVFDSVDLPTLCKSSHVSRIWRLVARKHQSYWKTLSLTTRGMSGGDAALFLDRLAAKPPNATFGLMLIVPAATTSLARFVLMSVIWPVLLEQLPLAEKLTFYISPAYTRVFWPIFTIDVPRLRTLHVSLIDSKAPGEPIPGLFQAHAHTVLEDVTLSNVALSPSPQPVIHTLKSVKATYHPCETSHLPRVLAWLPRCQSLDLMARAGDDPFLTIPSLSSTQLQALRHFVVWDYRYLDGIPFQLIPSLRIAATLDVPTVIIRQLAPTAGLLGVCFLRSYRSALGYHTSGIVIIASLDRAFVRRFERLPHPNTMTAAFLDAALTVHADRLVILTISLDELFPALCQRACIFPRLETLRLVTNGFPDLVPGWSHGAVNCHALFALVVQQEDQQAEIEITLSALQEFCRRAIRLADAIRPGQLLTSNDGHP